MIAAVGIGIMGAVFFGDLAIKERVERKSREGEKRALFGGKLILSKFHNRGMLLSVMKDRRRVVAALSLLLALLSAVLWIVTLGQKGNDLLRTGLALLVGGGFSNTYDRLRRKYVVDYLSLGVGPKWLRRVVFNLSDLCIMLGALMITLGAV